MSLCEVIRMPIETKGFDDLIGDITHMADKLDTSNEGAPAARKILQAAAVPVEDQMKANASHDPQIISGKLRGALNTGNAGKKGGASITIGVHRKDWSGDEYYPAYVEFGHGGPRPAPPHPFVRPAIDERGDEAIQVLIDKVAQALK